MHVIISGAGIAGPPLAWWLAKAGIRSTIIEKAPALLAQGQNIDIQGSAVSIVDRMGLLDQIRQYNTKEQGTRFIGKNGKPYACFPLNEECTASMTSEFEILRGDLATILYKATADHPLVTYHFGSTIKTVLKNNANAVEVELDNGRILNSDLLVLADGQWSKLRQQYFPSELVQAVDKGIYNAWWTVPRIPSDNDYWDIRFSQNSKNMSVRPDPHGTMRVMLTCMPRSEAQIATWKKVSRSDTKTKQNLIHTEFQDQGWQADRFLEEMTKAPDFYFQSIQQIKMSKWSHYRMVCLGDAAYAPTPLSGMGTSLAIDGAFVLAGELSKCLTGKSVIAALQDYDNVFRPFVEEAQDYSASLPSIIHPDSLVKYKSLQTFISLGSTALSVARRIPWLRTKINKPTGEDFVLPSYKAFES